MAWLAGCRRSHRCYVRKSAHFLAFVGIAATVISYRGLGDLAQPGSEPEFSPYQQAMRERLLAAIAEASSC